MRTGLLASTVTLGSTAPLVSRTMPLHALCALTTGGASSIPSRKHPTNTALTFAKPCMDSLLRTRLEMKTAERFASPRKADVNRCETLTHPCLFAGKNLSVFTGAGDWVVG